MNMKLKSILNVAWKAGLGLFGLSASAFVLMIADVWHEETRGRDYSRDRLLSEDIIAEAYNNDRMRVRNIRTGKYTTPRLLWVSDTPERDSLTVFCDVRGHRGYLNIKNGEIVIPAAYSRAWQFSEGLGAVLGKNDRIGFIDKDNNTVIDFEIPYERGFDYIFKDGYCVVRQWDEAQENFSYAVYGRSGDKVLDWGYTYISEPDRNGYRVISTREGSRLCDRDFNLIFEGLYEDVEITEGGNGVYLTENHKKRLVDFNGNVIEPFVIDNTFRLKYMVSCPSDMVDEPDGEAEPEKFEWLPDVIVYQVNNWDGLMDARTGRILTPAKYWELEAVSANLIFAKLGYGTEGVLLDMRGNIVR